MSFEVIIRGNADKGFEPRSARDEMRLRVRMLNSRHRYDVYEQTQKELGPKRAKTMGPIDFSRNTLKSYVNRVDKAYLTPPLVSGLSEDMARLIGDQSASVLLERYALAGGRPMPTRMRTVSKEALRFRLACNYVGTLIGFSERSRRPYLEIITPDDLEVEYLSDDPLAPSIIRHHRRRPLGNESKEVVEVYDLSNPDAPSYRVYHDDKDVTEKVHGQTYEGDAYWWRYEDGRPFCRIIISGDPREPFRGAELVEGSLRMGALYTHHTAGIRDASNPQRNVEGMDPIGADTDSDTGDTAVESGHDHVVKWQRQRADVPGQHWQDEPGYDPEVVGKALRDYELGLLSALDLPISFERTGGEPTETERKAMDEIIAATFDECRGHDSLVLRRVAATVNRATAIMAAAGVEGVEPTALPERALPVLYRHEVAEALDEAAKVASGGKVADTMPTGVQLTAMSLYLEKAANGQLPRESVMEVLVQDFNKTIEQAEKLLGSIGKGFKPTVPGAPGGALPADPAAA